VRQLVGLQVFVSNEWRMAKPGLVAPARLSAGWFEPLCEVAEPAAAIDVSSELLPTVG
jgi:hypothetical protein